MVTTILNSVFSEAFICLIYRTFTPVYCPSPLSGITPLLYVAQTRQSNILKILLQYGILEREKNPINIVITILLYPSGVRIMIDHELVDIQEDAKTCLVLCSRVLSAISIREIEVSKIVLWVWAQILINNFKIKLWNKIEFGFLSMNYIQWKIKIRV